MKERFRKTKKQIQNFEFIFLFFQKENLCAIKIVSKILIYFFASYNRKRKLLYINKGKVGHYTKVKTKISAKEAN